MGIFVRTMNNYRCQGDSATSKLTLTADSYGKNLHSLFTRLKIYYL